jgi:hypothetical protein
MTSSKRTPEPGESSGDATPNTDTPLQRELRRETAEGSDAIGDVRANRNLSGSSTWETMPAASQADGVADRPARTADSASTDPGAAERRRAEEEIAVRLRRRGVRLSGRETGEELLETLEAVERFEGAVEAGGGDLMMDEPVGAGSPIEPDDKAFVLPRRRDGESIAAFIERIAFATERARGKGR